MKTKLKFGLQCGVLKHISEVASGLSCECKCPNCESVLIAKKGKRNEHHFAHYSTEECKGSVETAIHLAAKEILKKSMKIKIPEVVVEFGSYKQPWIISVSKFLDFDKILIENKLDKIIPDIIIVCNGVPLIIEVTVTHGIDEEKLKKIKAMGVSALEIDLKSCDRDLNWDSLENLIINEVSNKKWVYNVRVSKILHYCIQLSEKKRVYQKGFNLLVICPEYEYSFVDLIDTCAYCDYNIGYFVDELNDEEYVFCSSKKGLDTFNNFREVVNRIR